MAPQIPIDIQWLQGFYATWLQTFFRNPNVIGHNPAPSDIPSSPYSGMRWRWGVPRFSPCLGCLENHTATLRWLHCCHMIFSRWTLWWPHGDYEAAAITLSRWGCHMVTVRAPPAFFMVTSQNFISQFVNTATTAHKTLQFAKIQKSESSDVLTWTTVSSQTHVQFHNA